MGELFFSDYIFILCGEIWIVKQKAWDVCFKIVGACGKMMSSTKLIAGSLQHICVGDNPFKVLIV